MREVREGEILSAGTASAKICMRKHRNRPEYPRDYGKLYSWLEDKLFNLFEAIALKQTAHIHKMSGEIIITASEIAELASEQLNQKEEEET